VLAHRGEYTEAERLAREALAIAEGTDGLNAQGNALCDLTQVLVAAGRDEEAADALAAALERYERKENIPMARRTRTQLMALRAGTSSV
jgi:tetratricopeptide (TPR) repeat protein